jgi:N6-adenosine-specific RNA methylase IME4
MAGPRLTLDHRSQVQREFDLATRDWALKPDDELDKLCERLAPIAIKLAYDDPRRQTWQTILGMADGEALRNG